jgi:glycosyltransferase involved in cell wall biosynthesis
MMSMGKCVIATRTFGQTDTIVDGVTGVYVPPSDPGALRATIQRLLASPQDRVRMGQAARKFIDENASLDLFVQKLTLAVAKGHAVRFG